MNTHEQASEPSENQLQPASESSNSHLIASGIGAASGGLVGAALGKSVGGKVGAAVGGIAGAIAGEMAANALTEFTGEVIEETSPALSLGLGADNKPIELPNHYSWDELQALSKPQANNGEDNANKK